MDKKGVFFNKYTDYCTRDLVPSSADNE